MARKHQAKSNGRVRGTPNSPIQHFVKSKNAEKVVISDPLGLMAGKPVDKRKAMAEGGNWEEKFNRIDEYARKEEDMQVAIQKAVDSSTYIIPVHVSDEVVSSDPSRTPAAEMLPQVGITSDRVEIDEHVERIEADSFNEGGDIQDPQTAASNRYVRREYNVISYGAKDTITDRIQLTRSGLNPEDRLVEELSRAVREYVDEQIFKGQAGADPDGFRGIDDWITAGQTFDGTGEVADEDKVTDLITEVEARNGDASSAVAFTDVRSFGELKKSLRDFQRYTNVEGDGELDFGFQVLNVDGVPVMKTDSLDKTSGNRELYVLDGSSHYLALLKGETMEVQARGQGAAVGDTEQPIHVHEFGCLVAQSQEHVAKYENLN